MKILAGFIILACGLSGCYEQNGSSPDPIMFSAPFLITDSGIFVYWESEAPSATNESSRGEVEQWWIEVQQCLNMEAEPPIVLIVDEVREFCPLADNPDNAVYCSNSGNEIPRIYIPLHDHEERRVWKHEFTHHILYENGEDENSELQDHKHAVWQCQWN